MKKFICFLCVFYMIFGVCFETAPMQANQTEFAFATSSISVPEPDVTEAETSDIQISETPPNSQDCSKTVFVTKTGHKYHLAHCHYLKRSKIPVTLDDAKQTYTPCSVCDPFI